jgi:hypothetical protein
MRYPAITVYGDHCPECNHDPRLADWRINIIQAPPE